jgi:DNA topoisomerase I
MKSLVIVESPTKAKTIKKYLPKGCVVDSSYGHIRDLPASASEIPPRFKKEKWANLGINVDDDYEPLYVISSAKKKTVKKLKDLISEAGELILATDEDREGEGISWHLLEVLKPKIPVKRMVFHEITEEAIREAFNNFRDVNMNLVNAQEARRIIDRLAGYTISPLLWKKIAPGLSAGRVQSVAVKFVVDRERERMRFRSGSYWDLTASLSTNGGKDGRFSAEMTHLNGKRLATGKDFDESTGRLSKPGAVTLLEEKEAKALRDRLVGADWKVSGIETNIQERKPAPPFITSTLQQEANRKFGFSASDTMRTAQRLYEEGFITYMRTDSTNLSGQAIEAARNEVVSLYGEDYLYKSVRKFGAKSKGAQEAHEAIRPAGSKFRSPRDSGLSGRELKLYDLIWKRTVATQMENARLEFTNVTVEAKEGDVLAQFRASGKKILFPGFFRAYVEGSDDPEAQLEDQEKQLPAMKEGDRLSCSDIEAIGHETKPPARFTEAALIKQLEKDGVGRPSTYSTIISTIQDRSYVKKDGNALVPTFTAFAVTELLEKHIPHMVDARFTSLMEDRLDHIASGEETRLNYLRSYFEGDEGLKNVVEKQESNIKPQDARRIDLPIEGLDDYDVMVGRFGPYAQLRKNGEHEAVSTSIPVDLAPGDITVEKLKELMELSKEGPSSLGKDPETGEEIYVLTGRFGPYVQLGEADEKNKKPKRASLLKGMKPEDLDLETALRLLTLPRVLGKHPETGKEVKAGVGRFGPFVVHDGTFKSLAKDDHVLEIGLGRALELLSEAPKKRAKGAAPDVLRELGEHKGEKVSILSGRYGPYFKFAGKNYSLPKKVSVEEFDLNAAVELIAKKKSG